MAGLPGIGNLNRRIQSLPQVISVASSGAPSLSTYGSAGATAALGLSAVGATANGICVIPNIPSEAAILVIPTFSISGPGGGLAIWSARRADDQAPAAQATLFQYAPLATVTCTFNGTFTSGFAAGALNFSLVTSATISNLSGGTTGSAARAVGGSGSVTQILVDALDSEFIALQFSTLSGGHPCQALYSYVNRR